MRKNTMYFLHTKTIVFVVSRKPMIFLGEAKEMSPDNIHIFLLNILILF